MNKDDAAKVYAEQAGAEAIARQLRAAAPKCRSCGAAMRWVETYPAGRKMPVDYDPHEDGNIVVYSNGRTFVYPDTPRTIPDGATVHFSHFATCPNADQFRTPRTASQAETLF